MTTSGHALSGSSWLIAGFVLAISACQPDINSREFAEKTTGGSAPPIPPPAKGTIKYSAFRAAPASDEIVPGLLSQQVFDSAREMGVAAATARAMRHSIEARNLLVGPGKRTAAASLPGGAIFEVRSGTGTITIGDREQPITTGSTFSVSEGQSFRLASGSDTELALRLYIIRLR